MSKQNVFSNDEVRICMRKCSTCIYRPGNLMMLHEGRKDQMEKEAVANMSVIPCHKTLGLPEQAVCRGFFDTQKHNGLLAVAERLGIIREVDADEQRAEHERRVRADVQREGTAADQVAGTETT